MMSVFTHQMVSQIKQYTEASNGRTVSANVFCIYMYVCIFAFMKFADCVSLFAVNIHTKISMRTVEKDEIEV